MEVRNINKYAGWYASTDDDQAKALILCQQKKIKQLTDLLSDISGELELAENPKEYNAETIISSVRALINQTGTVEHSEGYFKWIG